jgi:hypothetical protein
VVRTVARSSFRQTAQNLNNSVGPVSNKEGSPCKFPKMVKAVSSSGWIAPDCKSRCGVFCWPIATYASKTHVGRFQGIADVAGPTAAPPPSRLTHFGHAGHTAHATF